MAFEYELAGLKAGVRDVLSSAKLEHDTEGNQASLQEKLLFHTLREFALTRMTQLMIQPNQYDGFIVRLNGSVDDVTWKFDAELTEIVLAK